MSAVRTILPIVFAMAGLLQICSPTYAYAQGADDPAAATGRPSDDLGKDTRNLLALQASGRAAGHGSPIPGDQEAASYKRYLDSFNKPIPDFFTNTIKSSSGS